MLNETFRPELCLVARDGCRLGGQGEKVCCLPMFPKDATKSTHPAMGVAREAMGQAAHRPVTANIVPPPKLS